MTEEIKTSEEIEAAGTAAADTKVIADAKALEDSKSPEKTLYKTDEEKVAAEKIVTDKAAADKVIADKVVTDEAAADKLAAASKKVVPEKYEFNLPEDSLLTTEDSERISSYGLEKGLSQEEVTEVTNVANTAVAEYNKRLEKSLEDSGKQWAEAAKNDPEIGGADGTKLAESSELARRVMEKFGTPEFIKGLDDSKLGNWHEAIRVFSRIGKAMEPDKLIIANQTIINKPKSAAETLYGPKK